jgi:tape measure domain-containing protein
MEGGDKVVATVDDKVVAMSFENSKFQSGVNSTLHMLDKLKKALQFPNAGKGLESINAAANRTDLSHIHRGIQELTSKFSALRVVGIAALAGIAGRAVSAGAQFVKSFTFEPIMAGLHEYETNLNSVQTILANTQASGATLKDVNGALQELNRYSDKTIYNFSEMARNIGTFTAAGVDLKTSTSAIKGIANLAALSGSNSQQASTAMYQLSQAIASGRVSLQDWNSVVNAGMGGTVFQRALAQTAEKMGTLDKGAVSLKGKMKNVSIEGKSFRESIQAKPGEKSWLTSDVLTKTLSHFTGDLTDAQLKAEGFNAAEIKAIQAQAKTAMNAATQVKTLGQVFDVAKETMGSGWAQTFQTIFGDFGEAKTTFTALSNAINGFINTNATARNKVLGDWKALGGRKILIEGIKNAFHDLVAVIKPIKSAFRDIFPAKTGKDLFEMTQNFERLTERLKPGPQTVENLRRTFRGLFAILDIGKQIIGGIFTVIGSLFGTLGKGSGGFLNLTGSIGDFLVSVDQALKKGDKLHNFFVTLGKILSAPIHFIGALASAIAGLFGGSALGKAGQALGPLQKIIEGITVAWDKFLASLTGTEGIAKPAIEGISQIFGNLGQVIADALKTANFDTAFKVLEVGLLGGLLLVLKKAFSGGIFNQLASAFGGGIIKSMVQAFSGFGGLARSIGGTFNALTGSIQTMQQNVKSDTLKNIAISIALLAGSIVALSFVDPKRLNSALSAITIGFGQLLGAMAIMDKIGKSGGFIKMPFIAASMVVLAVAIDLLAVAVYAMSKLSWEQLAKGLGAVSVLLIGISAASEPLSKNSAGMIRAGVGIAIIGVALNILAQAIKSLGGMDMATLAKGIGGIGVALAAIGAASRLFPSGMISIGLGLIAIGAGVKLLSGSIARLGGLDMKTLAKGIGAIAIALVAIGLAMGLMPGPGMVVTAAGLLLVSIALSSISKTVKSMGGMSIEQLAKGLISMALALGILAAALYLMSGALPGAAALAVAAAGLALLAPALKSLGQQSWTQIIKGLVSLAAAFVLLGVAGIVLAPVAPAILALGVALIAVGAGLALAGAGVALIGIGLAAIAVAGPAAIKLLVSALVQLSLALPKMVAGLVKALVQMVKSFADAAPQFIQAIGKILVSLAQAIVVAAPQIAKAFTAIIQLILKVLRDNFPSIVATGFKLLLALLDGIKNNIAKVVVMIVKIVTTILTTVARNIPKIITAGGSILVGIVKGIANNIAKIGTAVVSIITKFISTITNNLVKITTAGVRMITSLLTGIANNIGKLVTAGANVVVKFINGIANAGSRIVRAGVNAIGKFINALGSAGVKLANTGAKAVIRFLNGVASAIRTHEPEMIRAGANVGAAIVQGMISGVGSLAGSLAAKVESMISALPKKALKLLGIHSPSKVFEDIGKNVVLGLASGIKKAAPNLTATVQAMLGVFENVWRARIAKFGSDNIRLLFGLGNDLSTAMYNGLLTGITDQSVDPISQAFSDVVKQIGGDEDTLEQSIKDGANSIKQSNADIKKDWRDLKAARKTKERDDNQAAANSIKQHTNERNAAIQAKKGNEGLLAILRQTAGFILTDPSLKKWTADLAAQRAIVEQLNKDLETQTQKLDDLKSKRQSLFDQTFEKFSALPEIVTEGDAAAQVNAYITSLSGADDAVGVFTQSLDTLQGMGLNADTYQQLLDIGPAAQAFVNALIAMGPGGIAAINAADADLQNAAAVLANHGADAMYKAGIETAQGLVNGINVKITDAIKAAEAIATAIVKAIKKKLKIKSPSEVFAEIGTLTMEGMANGLEDGSKQAVAAMNKAISDISAAADVIDHNPTITPILDLTQIQKDADQLGSMLNVVPITAAASFGQAAAISRDQAAAQAVADTAATAESVIKFEQNNYSPESLSSIEIYRQTKNQISQAKSALSTAS